MSSRAEIDHRGLSATIVADVFILLLVAFLIFRDAPFFGLALDLPDEIG